MARIELGTLNKEHAKLLLRCVRTEPRLKWFADDLEHDIAAAAAIPIAPWRKVVGRGRGLHSYEELECGHRYHLRYTKDWQEDHAGKRRCQQCLREQDSDRARAA